jgi:hypothetical protein
MPLLKKVGMLYGKGDGICAYIKSLIMNWYLHDLEKPGLHGQGGGY